MGQIFDACVYDLESKTCCVMDADKFHANCYSFSGAVFSVHYLLRQKPYHVMWGGGYVVIDDNLEIFSREEDLLGISTYTTLEDFQSYYNDHGQNIEEKSYYDKIKFIDEHSKLWKRISVWNEAKSYFKWDVTHSVTYTGYLVNHTKKLAIDLEDYYMQSKSFDQDNKEMAIDVVPVLTETGGGTQMALFSGLTNDTTENLAGGWRGDLLQIVDDLPEDYTLINCCFAEVWGRADYCYYTFGTDEEDFLLGDSNGKRFEMTKLSVRGKRGFLCYVKIELLEKSIKFIPVEILDQ